jgi:hypothetical protein
VKKVLHRLIISPAASGKRCVQPFRKARKPSLPALHFVIAKANPNCYNGLENDPAEGLLRSITRSNDKQRQAVQSPGVPLEIPFSRAVARQIVAPWQRKRIPLPMAASIHRQVPIQARFKSGFTSIGSHHVERA